MSASVIEILAALQEIDRRNRERRLEIEDIERQTAATAAALAEKRRRVEASRADSELTGSRRRALEAQLQDEEQRIKDQRMRLGRIRNDKEMLAAQREIDLAKESNSRLEEELLTLFEQVEAIDGNLREIEGELKALEDQSLNQTSMMAERAAKLGAEISQDSVERDAVAGSLSQSVRRKYEQIFEKRGGMAVVEVRDGSCLGCNMRVPPQLFIEIQKQREVIACPSCHRILYWRAETASSPDLENTSEVRSERVS